MSSRSLEELVNVDAPAWPGLRVSFGAARNPVEILPPDRVRCASTLEALQVTVRSTLGAIAYETGGVLIDDGYYPLRWSGWEQEAAEVPFDRALSLLPPPFFAEGKDLTRVSRRAIPAREVWSANQDFAKQLGGPR